MAFVLGLVTSTGCGAREGSSQLTLAVGPGGSAHEACGRAIAAVANDRGAAVTITGGALESLQALERRRAHLALAPVDTLARAVNGEGPFAGNTVSARTLATVYTSSLHLVVRDTSPIHGFSQLRGHTVGVGLPGSELELTARRALGAAYLEERVTARAVPLDEGVRDMAAGRLDAFFWLDAVPSPALERLVSIGVKVRLLNTASVVPLLQGRHGSTLYEAARIPAGPYGMTQRTDAVGVPTVLVSRPDLPETVAYAIVRSLFDRTAQFVSACPPARALDFTTAARSAPAAPHAGAARFYRQNGVR